MSIFPSRSRFRNRHHRCYELAFLTLMDLDKAGKAAGVTLVHGTITFDGVVIAHAWLESDDEAYDAAAHATMPIVQYVADHGATVERRYTCQEACGKFMLRTKESCPYGPWHETAGFLMPSEVPFRPPSPQAADNGGTSA